LRTPGSTQFVVKSERWLDSRHIEIGRFGGGRVERLRIPGVFAEACDWHGACFLIPFPSLEVFFDPSWPPSDAANFFHSRAADSCPPTVSGSFFMRSRQAGIADRSFTLQWRIRILPWKLTVMAKVYFYYSSMNAGKSTILLQSSYNYRERGMNTLVLTPEIDTRFGSDKVTSRIGLSAEASSFSIVDNLFERCQSHEQELHCVLVDEAQFLTKKQVHQLTEVADQLNIPVLAYGLRTDFQGNLFDGSMHLLAWADSLIEIKTICHCGRKATMVLRLNEAGKPVKDGDQVKIGGNERYISVCRRHFKEGIASRDTQPLPFVD